MADRFLGAAPRLRGELGSFAMSFALDVAANALKISLIVMREIYLVSKFNAHFLCRPINERGWQPGFMTPRSMLKTSSDRRPSTVRPQGFYAGDTAGLVANSAWSTQQVCHFRQSSAPVCVLFWASGYNIKLVR